MRRARRKSAGPARSSQALERALLTEPGVLPRGSRGTPGVAPAAKVLQRRPRNFDEAWKGEALPPERPGPPPR